MTIMTLPCAFSSQSSGRLTGLRKFTMPASVMGLFTAPSDKVKHSAKGGFDRFQMGDAYDHLIGVKDDEHINHPSFMYKDLTPDIWLSFAQNYFENNCKSFFNPDFDAHRFRTSTRYLAMLYYGALEEMTIEELREIEKPKLHPIFLEILARMNGAEKVLELYNAFKYMHREISDEQYNMIRVLFKHGYTHALRSLGKVPLRAFFNRYRKENGLASFINLTYGLFKNPLVSDEEVNATLSKVIFAGELGNLIAVKHGIMSRRDALVLDNLQFVEDPANKYSVLLTVGEYLKTSKPRPIHAELIRWCLAAFESRKKKNSVLTAALSPVYDSFRGNRLALAEFVRYARQFEDETGRLTLDSQRDSDDDTDDDELAQ